MSLPPASGLARAGTLPSVAFEVSDRTAAASETIAITIANTNRAPVLAPIGAKSGSEGSLLTFTVAATDADGDLLTYSASGLPTGASFDPTTKMFSWTPSFDQANTYPGVTFSVTRRTSTASETIAIAIANTNRAPTATNDTASTNEDTTLNVAAPGVLANDTDADGDPLTAIIVGGPAHGALT